MIVVSRRVGEKLLLGNDTVLTVVLIGSDSVDVVLTNMRDVELRSRVVLRKNESTYLAHGVFGPSSTAAFCNWCPINGLRHRLRALALQGRLGRQKSLLTDRRAKSDAGRLEGLARVALSGRADDERFLVHGNR